jgi:hypothetical protein
MAIEGGEVDVLLRGLNAVVAELFHASLPLGGFKIPQKI